MDPGSVFFLGVANLMSLRSFQEEEKDGESAGASGDCEQDSE